MIELIFGSTEEDIEALAKTVGSRLGLEFESRNSMYKGDYCLARSGEDEYQVVYNELADFDDIPEEEKEYEWQIETHKHCISLLWFDLGSDSALRVKNSLLSSGIKLELIGEKEY